VDELEPHHLHHGVSGSAVRSQCTAFIALVLQGIQYGRSPITVNQFSMAATPQRLMPQRFSKSFITQQSFIKVYDNEANVLKVSESEFRGSEDRFISQVRRF